MKNQQPKRLVKKYHNKGMPIKAPKKVQNNDPCHCGSGKKYKSCCKQRDEASLMVTPEEREKYLKRNK